MHRLRLFTLLIAFSLVVSTFNFAATTFSKTSYPTGNAPFAAASADINRDGFPDLIVSNNSGDGAYLAVLLGSSNGTFTMTSTVPVASNPVKIVAGDFNGDGFPDVAVLEQNTFQIFFSSPNGGLLPQTPHPIPATGVDMVGIQLNENGSHIPDLALTRCASTCSLELWVNDGTGTKFQETQALSLNHTFFNSLAAADFDRDGHDDIAVTTPTSIQIFHNNNNGTLFLKQTISPTGTDIFALAAGDIDAKNGPDLVFATSPTCFPDCIAPSPIYVYLNDGTGHLNQKQILTPNSNSTSELKLVDITGDNRLDLIVLNQELQMNNGSLSWAQYAGGGTFGSFATLAQLGEPRDLVARDLNLDSRHDFVIPDNGFGDFGVTPGTYVFLNTGSGAYCSMPSSANLTAKLCSPTTSTSSNTFTVTAVGNSPTGVRRVELWVDGKKIYNSPDDRLKTTVTLATGTHTFTIIAVDQFGATSKTSKSISVQ